MLKVAQSQAYQGDDWWDWSVWLKGDADLKNVEYVIWHLHPTFTPSSVKHCDHPSWSPRSIRAL